MVYCKSLFMYTSSVMPNHVILSLLTYGDNRLLRQYCDRSTSVEFVNLVKAKQRFKSGKYTNAASLSEINLLILTACGEWLMWVDDSTIPADVKAAINYIMKYPDRWFLGGYTRRNKLTDYFFKDTSQSLPFIINKSFLIDKTPITVKSFDQLADIAYSNEKLQLSAEYVSAKNNSEIKRITVPFVKLFFNKYLLKKSNQNNIPPISPDIFRYSKNVPIFINCRDRLSPLKKMVECLEAAGLKNIIFVDNASSYKPLLNYYDSTPYTILRLSRNIGQQAPWLSGAICILAKNSPYIVTDPDLVLPDLSKNNIRNLFNVLNKYSDYIKVGLALKIDNLPDHYKPKNKVIKWERQFWKDEIEKDIYIADVDTIFALYRPNTPYIIRPALRIAGSYTAEHEPWYQDSNNPTEEYANYLKHARREIASWGIDDSTSSSVYDD